MLDPTCANVAPYFRERFAVRFAFFFFFPRFGLGGTLPPARRASDSPIAIACLRLVTFFPERPLRSVPRLRSRITHSTFLAAFLPYFFAMLPPPVSLRRLG